MSFYLVMSYVNADQASKQLDRTLNRPTSNVDRESDYLLRRCYGEGLFVPVRRGDLATQGLGRGRRIVGDLLEAGDELLQDRVDVLLGGDLVAGRADVQGDLLAGRDR